MNASSAAVLVADIGSTALKAGLVTGSGQCVRKRSVPAPGGPSVATQDAEAVWERTADLLSDVAHGWTAPISAVVVIGQGDGLWRIDRDGAGATAYQWNSVAGADAVNRWEADGTVDDQYRRTGTVLWPGTSAALWHHLRQVDAPAARETRWVVTAPDWITYRLTGEVTTDVTNASIPFLDPRTRAYDPGSFERLGCPELAERVPEPREPGSYVAGVRPEVAERLGIRPGTPVHLGCVDVVAQAIGSGAQSAGDAVAVLGTTTAVTPLTRDPAPAGDPVGATVAWIEPGLHLRVLGSSSGGAVLDWFLETHGYLGEHRFEEFWEDVDRSDSDTEIVLPFLYGERVPFLAPSATGLVAGLTPLTRRSDLARAQAEGITMALRHCLESSGQVDTLVLTGGGSANARWCQLVADVVGRDVLVDSDPTMGLRGAASLAPGFEYLRSRAGAVRAVSPSPAAEALDARYHRYRAIIDALLPLWKETR
ncbi:MAG: FGGY family carbohydrate kinase [Actinomyces sp.]|jgi:sugar (pentulose or hexulose) kinase|nr:FGGY family carbohydrate kinase [Actinomyces sp.]MCI1642504.1 FGGY family carbohydrate kinase [Actinomyces sp.]MCI1663063.1 FGGY family carbohydrate kinase [Actinomyces sp.]MCI1691701.1 FGGY family carbohydrate kinase [Actinomyces sp.]